MKKKKRQIRILSFGIRNFQHFFNYIGKNPIKSIECHLPFFNCDFYLAQIAHNNSNNCPYTQLTAFYLF